jgi:multidrug resistance efflux pump
MNPAPPKLRSDLVISEQKSAKETIFIIKDPVSRKFFRFGKVEHFITTQLDGETPPDVIRQKAQARFGAELRAETLSAFLTKLNESGFLETEESRRRSKNAREESRVRGNWLYLRFKVLDPDRILNRMIRHAGFFFTPTFVVLSALSIVLATFLAVGNWEAYTSALAGIIALETLPAFILLTFIVVSAHEFAHGLTCKHFGGDVHEMGAMLIYFQPAFYCNVSDAWLFPKKSSRLWVGFAGMYFESFLWSLATFVWFLTDVDTLLNHFGLIVMTRSGLTVLANLNPLIKLDGYYLLSDYLDIPNLRKRAFRYTGQFLKQKFWFDDEPMERVSSRERRAFLAYGVIGSVFSFSLLTFVSIYVGGLLIENSQPVILALFMGLVSTRFRRRINSLWGNGADDDETSEQRKNREELTKLRETPEEKKQRRREKRKLRQRRRQVVLIAVGLLALEILFFGWMELRIPGPFNILPIQYADVRAEVDGVMEQVLVTEGDEIATGTLIARISDREHRASLLKARAELEQARSKLQMLEVGPTREEIAVAQASVRRANDRLEFMRTRLERSKLLFERDILSRMEYENVLELSTTAENDVVEEQKRLQLLLRGPRLEQVAVAQAEVAALETQVRHLEGTLDRVEIRSPVSGVVSTPARQLKELKYQSISKGTPIAKVQNAKRLTVEIAISEKEIGDIAVGHRVAFKARAFPDETFYGVVTATASTANAGGGSSSSSSSSVPTPTPMGSVSTILVTTEIDNSSLLLKPGMTGQAKIYCGERRIIELIWRRLARMFKVEFWSWW